jgi:hypothetical protein
MKMRKLSGFLTLCIAALLAAGVFLTLAACSLGDGDDDTPAAKDNPLTGEMKAATAKKIFTYTEDAESVTITKYKSAGALEAYLNAAGEKALAAAQFIIGTIDKKPVTGIGADAFDGSEPLPAGVGAIKLPGTIKELDAEAFSFSASAEPVTVDLLIPDTVIEFLRDTDPRVLYKVAESGAVKIKEVNESSPDGEEINPPAAYLISAAEMKNGTVRAGAKSAVENTAITLTISPDAGCQLKNETLKVYKTGDPGTVVPAAAGSTSLEFTFTMPAHDVTVEAQFEGWQINSAADMAKIGSDPAWPLEGDYELAADITLTDWMPIGAATQQSFTGTFDGKGKTITLNGFDPAAQDIIVLIEIEDDDMSGYISGKFFGLFWRSDNNAVIKNFTLVLNLGTESAPLNLSSTARAVLGGVVGVAEQTTVQNITLSGELAVNNASEGLWIGGIMGIALYTGKEISGCSSSLKIYASANNGPVLVGGIAAGFNSENAAAAIIENCHTTGAIKATGKQVSIGGLVAHFEAPWIKNCSTTGDISVEATSGSAKAGGIAGMLAGALSDINIINSFATGNISTRGPEEANAGGLASVLRCYNGRTVIIKNCYATGNVSSTTTGTDDTRAGGLIGDSDHDRGDVTIENCYAAGNIGAVSGGANIFAGGIIALHNMQNGGAYDIKACAALNQTITCSSSSGIGRVAGASYSGTLENNIANSAMTLNGTAVTAGDTHDGKNGASKTTAELETQSTWETLFGGGGFGGSDSAPWVWDSAAKRPKLYWQ